jgi:uncharacterized protein (TIGR00369 family)
MSEQYAPGRADYADFVRRIFDGAPFVQDLGIELVTAEPGTIESRLHVLRRHCQQDGYLHAGVAATIADHGAGAAAATLMPVGKVVLTVEFKLNLLRPGLGDTLRCRSRVLKAGRTLCVAESEVFMTGDIERLIAKATVTLAYVDEPRSP